MNAHWHDTTSVPGPVDPHGCCADQPTAQPCSIRGCEGCWNTPPTATSLAADLRAARDADAAVRLADGLGGERACFCDLGYECLGCGRARIARRHAESA